MVRLNRALGIFALLLLFVGAESALAAMAGAVRPSIVGGINTSSDAGTAIGYTGGLDIGFWMGPAADFMVGGEYLSRGFTGGGSVNFVQIPALLNFHLGPIFSLGGGGFYDVPVTDGAVKNYGVSGSFKIKPMLMPLFVESRLNYGLNKDEMGLSTTEFKVLLGFAF